MPRRRELSQSRQWRAKSASSACPRRIASARGVQAPSDWCRTRPGRSAGGARLPNRAVTRCGSPPRIRRMNGQDSRTAEPPLDSIETSAIGSARWIMPSVPLASEGRRRSGPGFQVPAGAHARRVGACQLMAAAAFRVERRVHQEPVRASGRRGDFGSIRRDVPLDQLHPRRKRGTLR